MLAFLRSYSVYILHINNGSRIRTTKALLPPSSSVVYLEHTDCYYLLPAAILPETGKRTADRISRPMERNCSQTPSGVCSQSK